MRIHLSQAVLLVTLLASGPALAGSKDECLEAHSRGQDLREKGHLARARQLFAACAQSSCPTAVQTDCAALNEEVMRLVPTVTFGARDATAADLPTTAVYVDGSLLVTRLDGRTHEIDPGKHVVRWVHDGHDVVLDVILNEGEKGRVLLATFPTDAAVEPGETKGKPSRPSAGPEASAPGRSVLPLFVSGVGAAAFVAGGVLVGLGLARVPANCTLSSNECAAPPGDPVFDDAHRAVSLANAGFGIGITGAAVLLGGLVAYFLQPAQRLEASRRSREPSGL